MELPRLLSPRSSGSIFLVNGRPISNRKWEFLSQQQHPELRLSTSMIAFLRPVQMMCFSSNPQAPPVIESNFHSGTLKKEPSNMLLAFEEGIEKVIYRFRFMTFLGVWGSLVGSALCFLKGCTYVVSSFHEYFAGGGPGGKVVMMLVEAIDVYLLGTVMLVFGMGLYELFISNINISKSNQLSHVQEKTSYGSFFGLFTLLERPQWLEIKSVNQLKTKVGHVIVMVLLVGLFEKSKKVTICSTVDLLCFSIAILLASGGLYLLSKLNKIESK